MTFRELHVLLRLYRAAPPALRLWADLQLPELHEAAEMTEPSEVATHQIWGPQQTAENGPWRVKCNCGWEWQGSLSMAEDQGQRHIVQIMER